MNTLKGNVERARLQRGKPHPEDEAEESEENEEEYCKIEWGEYEWGSDVSQLLLSIRRPSSLTILSASDLYSDLLSLSANSTRPAPVSTSSSCPICSISTVPTSLSWLLSPPCSQNPVNLEFTLPPVNTPNKTSVTVS
jgi:hypothetical protein